MRRSVGWIRGALPGRRRCRYQRYTIGLRAQRGGDDQQDGYEREKAVSDMPLRTVDK